MKIYKDVSNKTITDVREPLFLEGCKHILIENCHIMDFMAVGIVLKRCEDVIIKNCYFEKVQGGINAFKSKSIVISDCFCLNVDRFYTPDGSRVPKGQFVQFNECDPGIIKNNVIINELGLSNPEDAINLYKCYATESNPIVVRGNYINGGGPSRTGGGILLGDNGGSYQIADSNTLVDPGQYGIGCAGGTYIKIKNNKIYGKQQPFTNVGIYTYNFKYKTTPSHSITVIDNEIHFVNKDGVNNKLWLGGSLPGKPQNIYKANNIWVEYQNPPLPNQLWRNNIASNVVNEDIHIFECECGKKYNIAKI